MNTWSVKGVAKQIPLTSTLKRLLNGYKRSMAMALLYIASFLSLSVGPLVAPVLAAGGTRTINSATVDGSSSTTVKGSASITASVNVTTTGTGGSSNFQSVGWAIATVQPASLTCADTADHSGAGTYNQSFTITAPSSTGTYNAYFIAYQDDNCNAGASTVKTLTNAVTVDAAAPTTPTASPVAGSYNATQSVTLSSSDSGGSGLKNIYYTTNGTDPTNGSTVYGGPISVSSSETIKAIAYDNAGNTSGMGSFAYIIDTVAPDTPTATPVAGSYNSAQMVALSSNDTGGSGLSAIYYTLDGSTPDNTSTQYVSPIPVASSETLKAIAYDNAGNFSAVGIYPYVIDSVAPDTPSATPSAGSYNSDQNVTLASSDSGGSGLKNIYYTTDGSAPDNTSAVYTSAITVSSSETIKAIAYDNAGNTSAVGTYIYVIDKVAPTDPAATPGAGSYNSTQMVSLSSTDSGGSNLKNIYYTTNGSAPDSTSTVYTGPITVASSETIKAIAYDNAGNASLVASFVYIIDTVAPATPAATPGAGSYNSDQNVTLSSSDTGGSGLKDIYYTTDGSTPDNTSNLYTSPISVSSSETIKAIAYDNAGNSSNVGSFTYIIDKVVPADPTASPPAGSYNSTQMVSLNSTDSGGSGLAAIYYTTNGTTPDNTSTLHTAPIAVASSETIKAIAYDGAGNTSGVTSFSYIIDSTVPTTPTATPAGGTYNTTQNVTLNSTDSGGSGLKAIYYTTDGSAPDNTSVQYTSAISVSSSETIKAIAYDNAGNASSVATFAYIIDTVVPAAPTASPGSGAYKIFQTVSLSSSDTGGSGLKEIRYTTNGSTPDSSSTVYTGPILIAVNTTLKTIAYDNAGNSSSVATYTYVIDSTPPAAPSATPPANTYSSPQSVSLSSSDDNSGLSAIYYTTDGSTPDNTSTLYTSPINVSSSTTVKAIAYDNAGNASTVATFAYTINTSTGSGGSSNSSGSNSNTGGSTTTTTSSTQNGSFLAGLLGNDTGDGQVLGASTDTDNQDQSGKTLSASTDTPAVQKELVTQAKATSKAGKFIGLTWYWWIPILLVILALIYAFVRTNQNETPASGR